MHEMAITQNIVEIAGSAAEGRRVTRVTLEIGKLSGVLPDAIRFCFDMVAQGTALDGAVLEIREIDGLARCNACGAEFAAAAHYTPCPCGSHDSTPLRGGELNIRTMELEEAA